MRHSDWLENFYKNVDMENMDLMKISLPHEDMMRLHPMYVKLIDEGWSEDYAKEYVIGL